MQRVNPIIALLLWLTAAYAAGFVGYLGTSRGLLGLYPALHKPAWNPPDWVFAPVWTTLYALTAVAAWRVWKAEGKGLWIWWVGLALNALWPWLFFAWGRLGFAALECGLLAAAILATMLVFRRSDRTAAWLLTPHLAWVLLATALSAMIWRMNQADAKRVAATSVVALRSRESAELRKTLASGQARRLHASRPLNSAPS